MDLLNRMDVIISLPLPTDEADDLGLLRDAAQLVAARQVQDVQDERIVQVQHGQLRAAPAAHAQGRVQAVPEQDGERLEQDQPGAQHQADLMKTLCITWRQKEKKMIYREEIETIWMLRQRVEEAAYLMCGEWI